MQKIMLVSWISIVLLFIFIAGCGEEQAGEATFYVDNSVDGGSAGKVIGNAQPDIREDDNTVVAPQVSIGGKEVDVVAVRDDVPVDLGRDDVSADSAAGAQDASDIPGRPDDSEDPADQEPDD